LVLLKARGSTWYDLPTQNAKTICSFVRSDSGIHQNKYRLFTCYGRVANGTFWRAQELTRAIGQVFNCNLPQFDGSLRYPKDEDG